LPRYKPEDPAKGTRNFSEIVIQKIAEKVPEFIGGSAGNFIVIGIVGLIERLTTMKI